MKIEGDFEIGKRVLALNTTLKEPYKSVMLKLVGDLTVILEEPNFLEPYHDKVHIVAQLSPSGTVDLKIIPMDPITDAEFDEALTHVPEHMREEWEENFKARKERREKELREAARISIQSERGGITGPLPDEKSPEVEERYQKLKKEQEERHTQSTTVLGIMRGDKVRSAKMENGEVTEVKLSDEKKEEENTSVPPAPSSNENGDFFGKTGTGNS